MIAIAADQPAEQTALATKLGLTFALVSDHDLKLAAAYGVRERGEEDSLPAVFVVDAGGVVRWARVGDNIVDRVSVSELVQVLSKLPPAK